MAQERKQTIDKRVVTYGHAIVTDKICIDGLIDPNASDFITEAPTNFRVRPKDNEHGYNEEGLANYFRYMIPIVGQNTSSTIHRRRGKFCQLIFGVRPNSKEDAVDEIRLYVGRYLRYGDKSRFTKEEFSDLEEKIKLSKEKRSQSRKRLPDISIANAEEPQAKKIRGNTATLDFQPLLVTILPPTQPQPEYLEDNTTNSDAEISTMAIPGYFFTPYDRVSSSSSPQQTLQQHSLPSNPHMNSQGTTPLHRNITPNVEMNSRNFWHSANDMPHQPASTLQLPEEKRPSTSHPSTNIQELNDDYLDLDYV